MWWKQDLKFCIKSGHLHGLPLNLTYSIAGQFLVSNSQCSNCAIERLSSLKLNAVSLLSSRRSMKESILLACMWLWWDWVVGFSLVEIFFSDVFCWVDGLLCSEYGVGDWCLLLWLICCRLMYIKYVSLPLFIILSKVRWTWSKICYWPWWYLFYCFKSLLFIFIMRFNYLCYFQFLLGCCYFR